MNSHNTGAVTITKGKTATIAGFTNTVVANTDTMFLVMDKDSNCLLYTSDAADE